MNFIFGKENKFIEFMSNLNEKDKIAVFAHNDLDGIVSAIIMEKVIGKFDFLIFSNYNQGWLISILSELKARKINKVIFLDLCIEEEIENLKKIEKFLDILIIDHHQWKNDINSEKISFLLTEQKDCPSFVCYDLSSKFQNVKELELLVAIAMISDYSFSEHLDFINKVSKKNNLNLEKLKGFMLILSKALIYFKDKKTIEDFSLQIKKIEFLEEINNFRKYSDIIDKEIKRLEEGYLKKREEYSWGYFYFFKKEFSISSYFSTKMSEIEENKLLIFVSNSLEDKNFFSINLRCQSKKYNCEKIIKKAIDGFDKASGGGHIPAASGQILKKDFDKFKENLLSEMRNLS